MIKNVLQNIGGIGIYGVISICLFFAVFILAVVWAFRLNRSFTREMSLLPLDDETADSRKGTSHHD